MRFYITVSGAKYVDPVSGFAYWWPDENEGLPSTELPEQWEDLGYIEDGVDFR